MHIKRQSKKGTLLKPEVLQEPVLYKENPHAVKEVQNSEKHALRMLFRKPGNVVKSKIKPYLYTSTAGILFGTSGFFVANMHGMNPIEIAAITSAFSSTAFGIGMLATKKKFKVKDWKSLSVAGLSQAVSTPLFFGAISAGAKIGEATLLSATSYAFSMVFSSVLLKEKPDKISIGAMIASFVGAGLILQPTSMPNPADLLALASGLSYGLTFVSIRKSQKSNNDMATTMGLLSIPAIVLGPLSLINPTMPSISALGLMSGLSVSAYLIPQNMLTKGLTSLQVNDSGAPLLLEPLSATVIGYVALGQTMGILQIVGGSVIVGSTLALMAIRNKKELPPGNDAD
jgi:drug/metabolite transporter (DMT)-like permease